MALPIGKLTIIVGAGLLGSVLAKEGLPSVSDIFSGAFKFGLKQLKQDNSTATKSKPRSDHALVQQVNSLREELQLLASNRSITIVSGNRSGTGKYGAVVIVIVVGYGYIWWKGWKLSDMMFATRRGLNDACSSVAKQLDNVYSSVSSTKKHLSSRIDHTDCKLDEHAENMAATKDEVSELLGDVKLISADVQSVQLVVQSLGTKISRIEERQNETTSGVGKLVSFARNLEKSRRVEQIEAAPSRPTLELPRVSPSRAVSLPTTSLLEPPSPSSSNGSVKTQTPLLPSNSSENIVPAFGLKDLDGISKDVGLSSPGRSSDETRSGGGLFGRGLGGIFTRSRSAMQSFK